jgi:hypothetical protein
MRAFWDIALCSLKVDRRFRGAYFIIKAIDVRTLYSVPTLRPKINPWIHDVLILCLINHMHRFEITNTTKSPVRCKPFNHLLSSCHLGGINLIYKALLKAVLADVIRLML